MYSSYFTAKNTYMHKLIDLIRYYTDKRFSTVAGTLVYFLLMSIAPFILWLTVVFGNVDLDGILANEIFGSVAPVLRYLKTNAQNAAAGAGAIFLATSLYSSSNFFYHIRRSGEIIYECQQVERGIRLRIISLILIAVTIIMVALTGAVTVFGNNLLSLYMPPFISQIIQLVSISALAIGVAIVLNTFACPYKNNLTDILPGSLLTAMLWLILFAAFGIYTKFSSPEKLYGKVASVIVFLVWCYFLMCCLVIGMINNGRHFPKPKQIPSLHNKTY